MELFRKQKVKWILHIWAMEHMKKYNYVNREVQTKENIHNSIKIFTAKRSIDRKHNVDYKSS